MAKIRVKRIGILHYKEKIKRMGYEISKDKCKELDSFLIYLLNKDGEYPMNIKGDDYLAYKLILDFKPSLITGNDEVFVSEIGKEFINSGGFQREFNQARIKAHKESEMYRVTYSQKALSIYNSRIAMAFSLFTAIYTIIDVVNKYLT